MCSSIGFRRISRLFDRACVLIFLRCYLVKGIFGNTTQNYLIDKNAGGYYLWSQMELSLTHRHLLVHQNNSTWNLELSMDEYRASRYQNIYEPTESMQAFQPIKSSKCSHSTAGDVLRLCWQPGERRRGMDHKTNRLSS